MSLWVPTSHALPTDDRLVECETPGGDVRRLRFDNGLWWLPDKLMYVYFWPTRWREIA